VHREIHAESKVEYSHNQYPSPKHVVEATLEEILQRRDRENGESGLKPPQLSARNMIRTVMN
jgi:hypothetical protein